MDFLLILLVVTAVVIVVGGPLRSMALGGGRLRSDARERARRADLQIARDAKYAEIRDAELDRRVGKLSEEDFRELDRQLRGEAIEILRELDALGPEQPDD